MINILTVKWGTKYNVNYVNNLYAGVCRNTSKNFKFHCFTDNSKGFNENIIVHDLPYKELKGWWNKLYLFSNEIDIPNGDTIFYIDLDTLIVRNIDNILSYKPEKIVVIRDFYSNLAKSVKGTNNVGSGLMMWKHGDYENIWTSFIKNPEKAIESIKPHGDQKWIQQMNKHRLYWQDIFPNEVVSFKVHCNSGLQKTAKIVCYHGRPSIPDSATKFNRSWVYSIQPQRWVLNHWRPECDPK